MQISEETNISGYFKRVQRSLRKRNSLLSPLKLRVSIDTGAARKRSRPMGVGGAVNVGTVERTVVCEAARVNLGVVIKTVRTFTEVEMSQRQHGSLRLAPRCHVLVVFRPTCNTSSHWSAFK